MKVLIINRDIGTGSVGKICEDIYHVLKKEGNECKIAYAWKNKSNVPLIDLFPFCQKRSMFLNVLSARLFDNDGLSSQRQTKKLLKFIDDYKPDIIHIHGCYGYYMNIKLLFDYAKKTNIPIIDTLHSCWDFTGHCCYFTAANCSRWKTQCHNCVEKKGYPQSWLFDKSKRNFLVKQKLFSEANCTIVAPSEWIGRLAKESLLKDHSIFIIRNGIDTDVFKPTSIDLLKYGISSTKKIILGVASVWSKRKGLDDFLELAKVISDNYQIVLIGLSKKQIRKMPKSIISLEKTESKEELAALYSSATVLFNPTYEDNYPTVNLESIACGTPVVTYDTGGSPEAVLESGYGRIIKNKDYKGLLDYVKELDYEQLPPTHIFVKKISKKEMVLKYISLYDLIIKGC